MQLDHVEPAPELASDLALDADELEPAGAVEGDRSIVVADDAGDDGVKTVGGAEPEKLVEEEPPDSLAPAVPSDVDGVLDSGGVRRSVLVGGQRPESQDVVAVSGNDGRMSAGMGSEPGPLLLVGTRYQVEGNRGFGHLDVVDRADGLGVFGAGQPDEWCGTFH